MKNQFPKTQVHGVVNTYFCKSDKKTTFFKRFKPFKCLFLFESRDKNNKTNFFSQIGLYFFPMTEIKRPIFFVLNGEKLFFPIIIKSRQKKFPSKMQAVNFHLHLHFAVEKEKIVHHKNALKYKVN